VSENEAIHTRLDYMEEKFDSRLEQLTEAMVNQANAISKLTEYVSDMRLMEARINSHSSEIQSLAYNQDTSYKALDARQDNIERKIPIYDLGMKVIGILGFTMLSAVATAIYSLVIV